MKSRYRGRVARRAVVAVLGGVAVLFIGVFAQSAGAQAMWTCNGVPATIVGTPQDDVLRGTSGPDVIVGREGHDAITALDGDDLVCGGKGNDRIFGGGGFDILYGAQGNDTIWAANGSAPDNRADTRGARMFGGAGNDTIHGSTRWDRMQGGVGQDQLFGYEGRDWMRAGPDNDTVDGGPAIDDLHGGNGRDTIRLTDGDSVRGGAGLDLCTISAGAPAFIRSCGLNTREVRTPPPDPTPSNGFSYTDFSGTTWTGEIYGLVPVAFGEFTDAEGRCLLLVGELTPRTIDRGVVSSGFDTPDVGVIAGGEYIDDSYGCDASPAETLGYDWILNAEALPGTTIPFFAYISIPTTNTGAITSIVVGDPRFGNSYITFAPTILPSVPTPTGLTVGAPAPAEPLDGNATFNYTESIDSAWNGEILQVIPAAFSRFTSESGRCFIVLGELTPTKVDGLVSSGFDTPSIGGIAGGRHISSGYGCDTSAVEAQGYSWILNAEVTVGTTYRFYSMIVVPDANQAPLSQLIVGRATGEALVFNVQ